MPVDATTFIGAKYVASPIDNHFVDGLHSAVQTEGAHHVVAGIGQPHRSV